MDRKSSEMRDWRLRFEDRILGIGVGDRVSGFGYRVLWINNLGPYTWQLLYCYFIFLAMSIKVFKTTF